ncbi:unnamed protein product, partial [Mesorhabditis belari]|uniref:Uncharacterized protein n=1 Tax=Mesorhabditis belari TaxID=2138241 RepID=A0AAF3F0C3_9BILA
MVLNGAVWLSDLCPDGLVPLTNERNVRTCQTQCPREARCVQGICCALPPNCNDFTHKFETNLVCLPKFKQNCPKNAKCVESSRPAQSICCSAIPPELTRIIGHRPLETVCPADHPVLGFERRGLQVCKNCERGLCVPFRNSEVMICCHSHESLCGVESEICGAGCARFEKCESLAGGRWCCPRGEEEVEMCPGEIPTSGICSLNHPDCGSGNVCVATESGLGFICCPDPGIVSLTRLLKGMTPLPSPPTTTKAPTIRTFPPFTPPNTKEPISMTFPLNIQQSTKVKNNSNKPTKNPRKKLITTTEISTIPIVCPQGGPPMGIQDAFLMCPEIGAPCPRAGYTCQETNIGDYYCCPMGVDEWELEELSPKVPKPISTTTAAPWLALLTLLPKSTTTTTTTPSFWLTTTSRPIPSTLFPRVPAKCPFGHHSIIELNGELRSCAGWFDFTCPLTYSCMASSTTLSYICCKLNHTMHDELSRF